MGIDADIYIKPVVNTQRKHMFPRTQAVQHIFVRGLQRILASYRLAVQKESCLPVGTFQLQDNRSILPSGRDVHLLLIPRNTDVMFVRIQPKGDFDIPFLPIFGIGRGFIPRAVYNLSRPLGVQPHIFTFPLLLQGTRQPQCLSQYLLLPFLFYAYILRV